MGEVNRWTTKLEEVNILLADNCSIVFIYAHTRNRGEKKVNKNGNMVEALY